MKLAELQAALQAAILAGDAEGAAILECLAEPLRDSRAEALSIYVNAYRIRLREFLAEDYPVVKALLGEARFSELTEDYIAAHPPQSRNARWFSSRLPQFMRESEAWGGYLREISVATLERALTDAYDAAEATPLTLETLAAFDPQDWPRLAFAFHPSLALFKAEAGTRAAFAAVTAGEEAPPAEEGELEPIAVWRAGWETFYRGLAADEYLALNEARAGRAFGDICELAAFQQQDALSPERLAQFLVTWFADGLIVGVSTQDQSSNTPSSA